MLFSGGGKPILPPNSGAQVSPDSVIWYTYLSLVVQLAMVLVLVLGNYAACKEKFTKEDQAAAAEDITTLRQRLRNAAESVLMLLTMVACSACAMLHGWLQRSCQQMVRNRVLRANCCVDRARTPPVLQQLRMPSTD